MSDQKPPSVHPLQPAFPADAIEKLLVAGKALGTAQTPSGLRPFVILPSDWNLEPLDFAKEEPLPPLPDHIREVVTIQDTESFISYVKLYQGPLTRVFATPLNIRTFTKSSTPAKFTAIIDYHQPGKEALHSRKGHVALFACPLSEELLVWLGKNGQRQAQLDFVEFIESNAPDIVTPEAAKLMEFALNFSNKTTVAFKSTFNRTTGGRILTYDEDIDISGGQTTRKEGKMTVPERMTLKMPVFEGGKSFDFQARIDYRTDGGKLTIAFHLLRAQDVFRAAFKEVRSEIEAGVSIPILTGSVEVED